MSLSDPSTDNQDAGAGGSDPIPVDEPINRPGFVGEFVVFLKHNKTWWLAPLIVLSLLLIGAALLMPSPVAPFIYTLF